MSTTNAPRTDELGGAASKVLEVIAAKPGELDAVDVIAALRDAPVSPTAVRRAIWQLISTGRADLTDELRLVPR